MGIFAFLSNKDNIVFVGRKPVMEYVFLVIELFYSGLIKVILKARGKAIRTAVDTAEIVKQRLENVKVEKIGIGTDIIPLKEGGQKTVSKIEITLTIS